MGEMLEKRTTKQNITNTTTRITIETKYCSAYGQALSSQSRPPTLEVLFSRSYCITPIRRMIVPLPLPSRRPETIDLTRDDVEDEQEQFFSRNDVSARNQ